MGTKKKYKYGWMCGGCSGGSWNMPRDKTCRTCGMRRKKARLLWFARLKSENERFQKIAADKREADRIEARMIARRVMSKVTTKVNEVKEKSDAQIYGADLFAMLELVERNSEHIADGHLTLMRFTTGWKAFYGTPSMEMGDGDGDMDALEGGYNSVREFHMSKSVDDALMYLLCHPKEIGYDGNGLALPAEQPDEKHGVFKDFESLSAHATVNELIAAKKKSAGVVIRAASCDIKHDHSIGLCRVPWREKKKPKRKRKHGKGSIYKVRGCANWFLKFVMNGKQCFLSTGSSDKKIAHRLLKEEMASERRLQERGTPA